jgi:hypothetical protein
MEHMDRIAPEEEKVSYPFTIGGFQAFLKRMTGNLNAHPQHFRMLAGHPPKEAPIPKSHLHIYRLVHP